MLDSTTLQEQISALLGPGGHGDLPQLEHTLTDGYAKALSLEAERWRIEKRIGEVASAIGAGDSARKARELSSLAERLAGADGELTTLRGLLSDLRRRADDVRTSARVS